MKLYFTRQCILNTELLNDEGEEAYFVQTPWKLTRQTTTITKADKQLEVFAKFTGSLISDSKSSLNRLSQVLDARAQYELAQIHWRCWGSSRLQFGGFERDFGEYVVRSGFLGCRRSFTAPDGKSYQWTLGAHRPELHTNDEHRQPIAKFHNRRISIPGICKGSPPYLEIYPAGEHIADVIVMTFVHIEKVHKYLKKHGFGSRG